MRLESQLTALRTTKVLSKIPCQKGGKQLVFKLFESILLSNPLAAEKTVKKAILVLAALSIVGAYVWAHYHSNNSPDRQQLATQIRILEYTLAEDLALAVNETFGPNDPWSDELYTAISNKTCITSEACLTEIIEDGWNSLRWGITENIPIIRTQADSLREEPKPKIPAKDLLTKLHALDSNSQRDFIEAVVNIRMWERYSPQLEKQQRIDELKKQLPLPQ